MMKEWGDIEENEGKRKGRHWESKEKVRERQNNGPGKGREVTEEDEGKR